MSIFTLTPRDEANWRVADALARMQTAKTPQLKLAWAKRLNQARRERGDFEHIVAAKRERLDQAGERREQH